MGDDKNAIRHDAGEVIEAIERLSEVEPIALGTGPDVMAVPRGKTLVDLRPFEDARLERPRRRKGQSEHTTLASFLEHVQRSHDDGSVVFAKDDPKVAEFLAIYDYNEMTEVADYRVDPVTRRPGTPRFGEHRARYAMPFSDEWLAWMAIAGPDSQWLGQLAFAQALEDRGLDVMPPSEIPTVTAKDAEALGIVAAGPSQLMNLSRGLLVRADRKVGSAVNLASGEGKVTFEETHQATVNDAPVIVPNGFALSIPVFRDGAAYAMLVRLRYRVDGAAIKWKLGVHRADVAFRDAFYDVAKDVRSKTGLPLFYGTAEK